MNDNRFCRAIMWGILGWWLVATAANAQEASRHISVIGKGKVKAMPNVVELTGVISADAELAGDALTKFRATKQSTVDALNKLGMANVSIEFGNFTIGPPIATDPTVQILNRARGGTVEAPKMAVQESIRIPMKQIDKLERDKLVDVLAKLLDTAKEAGVWFGPPPGRAGFVSSRDESTGFTTFSIDDPQSLRQQAEVQAMDNARGKAERLASLSGCHLGEVRSLQESTLVTTISSSGLRNSTPEQSTKLDELEFAVQIQVQFTLVGEGKH